MSDKHTPQTWDADDLPETYWILASLHGFKFILDLAEGERVGALLDAYQFGGDLNRPAFLRFVDYTGAVGRVQFDFIDSVYLSTASSRGFDDAIVTDRKKRGWGEAGE